MKTYILLLICIINTGCLYDKNLGYAKLQVKQPEFAIK